ncbi:MAG: LysR family transcriptional regulator [Bifidobacteriaceae bacterium]|jgi:DNA-binding transcriptional LysR family regulator|nr:LysR family transcriptional regulator [Bifidobacteriaceae bacterium]
MSKNLEIAHLRSLVAIEDCGGFTRAAAALRLSQPTVSQHVRILEKRIGQALFRQEGRGATLTPLGRRALVEARRVLASHDEALARLAAPHAPPIVIGSTETAAEQVLPDLLTALKDAYQGRDLQFLIDRSAALAGAVDRGALDLAILLDIGASVPGTPVGELQLGWFSQLGWSLPPGPVPLISYARPCGMRERVLDRLNRASRSVRIAAEAAALEGVIAAVRAGLGVAALPNSGRVPEGLEIRRDLPDLGSVVVRLAARAGLAPAEHQIALDALRTFFANRKADASSSQFAIGHNPPTGSRLAML